MVQALPRTVGGYIVLREMRLPTDDMAALNVQPTVAEARRAMDDAHAAAPDHGTEDVAGHARGATDDERAGVERVLADPVAEAHLVEVTQTRLARVPR